MTVVFCNYEQKNHTNVPNASCAFLNNFMLGCNMWQVTGFHLSSFVTCSYIVHALPDGPVAVCNALCIKY